MWTQKHSLLGVFFVSFSLTLHPVFDRLRAWSDARVVRERSAKPSTGVRFSFRPHAPNFSIQLPEPLEKT